LFGVAITVETIPHFFSRFFAEAAQLGYQGELEIISFLILLGLSLGAVSLAVILIIYAIV
jgi:hypothetical protein